MTRWLLCQLLRAYVGWSQGHMTHVVPYVGAEVRWWCSEFRWPYSGDRQKPLRPQSAVVFIGWGIRLGGDLRRHPVWWFSKVFQGLDACKSPLETLLNIQTLWSYSLSRPRFSASRAENRLLDSPPRVILILMYKHTPVGEFLFKSNFLSYSELSIPFSLMTAGSSEDLFLTEELEPGEVPLAGLVAGCGRGCWGRNDVRAQGWELGPVEAQ